MSQQQNIIFCSVVFTDRQIDHVTYQKTNVISHTFFLISFLLVQECQSAKIANRLLSCLLNVSRKMENSDEEKSKSRLHFRCIHAVHRSVDCPVNHCLGAIGLSCARCSSLTYSCYKGKGHQNVCGAHLAPDICPGTYLLVQQRADAISFSCAY